MPTERTAAGAAWLWIDTGAEKVVGAGYVRCPQLGAADVGTGCPETLGQLAGKRQGAPLWGDDQQRTSYVDNRSVMDNLKQQQSEKKLLTMANAGPAKANHALSGPSTQTLWRGCAHDLSSSAEWQLIDHASEIVDEGAGKAAIAEREYQTTQPQHCPPTVPAPPLVASSYITVLGEPVREGAKKACERTLRANRQNRAMTMTPASGRENETEQSQITATHNHVTTGQVDGQLTEAAIQRMPRKSAEAIFRARLDLLPDQLSQIAQRPQHQIDPASKKIARFITANSTTCILCGGGTGVKGGGQAERSETCVPSSTVSPTGPI